jgi:hypothetical protein
LISGIWTFEYIYTYIYDFRILDGFPESGQGKKNDFLLVIATFDSFPESGQRKKCTISG